MNSTNQINLTCTVCPNIEEVKEIKFGVMIIPSVFLVSLLIQVAIYSICVYKGADKYPRRNTDNLSV